jgi:hypothetical protein
MTIANDNNIKRGKSIITEISTIVCDWEKYATQANVSADLKNSISDTLIAPKFK